LWDDGFDAMRHGYSRHIFRVIADGDELLNAIVISVKVLYLFSNGRELTPKQLEQQMQLSIQNSYDRAGNVIRDADAEIARTRSILASMDELENELAKIGHIREIVKSFRARIESLDHRLDQSSRRRH
jgi:hypothetical protein